MTTEVSELLWRDTSIFAARYTKTAAALAAIDRVLERRQLPGPEPREFRRLRQQLWSTDVSVFTEVWRDPYAYYWVRIAFELLGSTLRGSPLPPLASLHCAELGIEEPRAALQHHLSDFKRLVLGACILSNERCAFEQPLTATLPLAIPGTRLSVVATGNPTVEINGCGDGTMRLEAQGRSLLLTYSSAGAVNGSIRIVACPTVEYARCRLKLQPHAYHLPGFGFAEPFVEAGLEYQERNRGLVETALSIVHEHLPDTWAQFREVIRLVALKPRTVGSRRNNFSHSDLPGAIAASAVPNPYYLADVFIHEFHHNRLFFIEELNPLLDLDGESLEATARCYSPWRDDDRPLHGIFHGLYVYVPTCRFWLDIYRRGTADPQVNDAAADRLLRGVRQLRIGAHQLRRHARLTPFGDSVLASLQHEIQLIAESIRSAGLPDDAPAVEWRSDGTVARLHRDGGEPITTRQAVLDHLSSSTLSDQVRDILDHIIL